MTHNSWELVSPSCNRRCMNIAVGYQMRKYSYMYDFMKFIIFWKIQFLGKNLIPTALANASTVLQRHTADSLS